ncbi:hypothetical protein JCM19236_490 [Vibrio sp. JCM 19236]|nr:hypothetical protein JCM19236_490 [Vibrio sp. JCM 19236]
MQKCLGLLALLASFSVFSLQATAEQDYAIFSLDTGFDELSVAKARQLYRGKPSVFKENALSSQIGQTALASAQIFIATYSTKT